MKSSVKAFTLTELLLAAAILAFVIAGLLMLFINCAFLNTANRNLTVAIAHAQFAMEEIKNTTFASIGTNYNGICWNATDIQNKGLIPLDTESICFSITGSDPLNVWAGVTWKDRGVRDRNAQTGTGVVLQTYITEP